MKNIAIGISTQIKKPFFVVTKSMNLPKPLIFVPVHLPIISDALTGVSSSIWLLSPFVINLFVLSSSDISIILWVLITLCPSIIV